MLNALRSALPGEQVVTDELRRLAYGTDASFYRLIPKVVVIVHQESEVRTVLDIARRFKAPVTFRAAGTSLSGQAISDSILMICGEGFATSLISDDARQITLGPAMIGGEANRRLAPHGRKIGPDPASINACKIGGIAANNASGMCCGTAQNSYRTLAHLRILLADGTLLDTGDAASVAAFRASHGELLRALAVLAESARLNPPLRERIERKFRIKNTTGYSLNALIDFTDPVDILAHLMIGSEGTLAFLSSITYHTVVEDPHKASALVFFPDIRTACQAVTRLKPLPVAAVELLDRPALRSAQDKPGLPTAIRSLSDEAAALLIEVRDSTPEGLQTKIATALGALEGITTVEPAAFSSDPATCEMYWKVRKGTFPSVGAMRQTGTTVIIEDVAFPVAHLAEATLDLQALLRQHGYPEAIIFGHALEGNLHFVFTQDFGDPAAITQYARFMDDVVHLVVDKYDGSLKAEHGTGRNMAPFVEVEWGQQATALMQRIKQLFDPEGLLNPGVILDSDPQAHLKHLKPMPAANPLVDRCIECGFCEPLCPSHQLTLSPRQRIASWRALSRQATSGEISSQMRDDFAYQGLDTCAGCGLCATACPVGIDTGALTRDLRGARAGQTAQAMGHQVTRHFAGIATAARLGLGVGQALSTVLGDRMLGRLSLGAWKQGMPRSGMPASALQDRLSATHGDPVVYFPTCASRIFGPGDAQPLGQSEAIIRLLERAGYRVLLPAQADTLCCGQMLASKGLAADAEAMSEQLAQALLKAADDGQGGTYPVIMDASTCTGRMQDFLGARLGVYDFHEFAHDALLPRLVLQPQPGPVALHVNCSVRKRGSEAKLRAVLRACCTDVIEPEGVGCCGFAGDRGFVVPELNAHALRHLNPSLDACGCTQGISTNRTCEIGLTHTSGRPYRSLAHLLEECSRPLAPC